MTDLARLQSQIAAFVAGAPSLPETMTRQQGPATQFLLTLPADQFDAVHVLDGTITQTIGAADDLIALAQHAASEDSSEMTTYVCMAPDDLHRFVFFGFQPQEVIILRSRTIDLSNLLDQWNGAFQTQTSTNPIA